VNKQVPPEKGEFSLGSLLVPTEEGLVVPAGQADQFCMRRPPGGADGRPGER
jgi:hypothetical protein